MIKTFRGLLVDGQQERIRLETIDGKTGYRIKKFDLLPIDPDEDVESAVKVYSIKQTVIDADINFSEQTLLAAGILRGGTSVGQPITLISIFDKVTFNQDIFVTNKGASYTRNVNYYLELETVSLDDVEATAVILKNFRNTNSTA